MSNDFSNIPLKELLFDRQECHNDLTVLAIAKLDGIENLPSGGVDDRIEDNLRMIEIIRKECGRRNIDPAQYQGE